MCVIVPIYSKLICLSTLMGQSPRRVLQISGQVLGRAMAAAVLVAFVALGFYDSNAPYDYGVNLFGTNIGFADIISIIVLLAGMEIYGRDPEPEQEAITNFSPSA